jgi:RNA polymerase sigma factor (sigma-70 family)
VALRAELERDKKRGRLDRLTPREREVMMGVVKGRTSREIAEDLGISHRTVETHRERVMAKLRMRSVADLTRFVVELGLEA